MVPILFIPGTELLACVILTCANQTWVGIWVKCNSVILWFISDISKNFLNVSSPLKAFLGVWVGDQSQVITWRLNCIFTMVLISCCVCQSDLELATPWLILFLETGIVFAVCTSLYWWPFSLVGSPRIWSVTVLPITSLWLVPGLIASSCLVSIYLLCLLQLKTRSQRTCSYSSSLGVWILTAWNSCLCLAADRGRGGIWQQAPTCCWSWPMDLKEEVWRLDLVVADYGPTSWFLGT